MAVRLSISAASLVLLASVTSAFDASICASGYEYNPFSKTCFRVLYDTKTWDQAQSHCALSGESLAVLDTLESIAWFKNLRQTNALWKNAGWVWLGGKKVNNSWLWQGRRYNEPIMLADWDHANPSGNGNCLHAFDARTSEVWARYMWDDVSCAARQHFVCEKYIFCERCARTDI